MSVPFQGKKSWASIFSPFQHTKTTIDKKTIDRTWKVMDKVVTLCSNRRLKLKNSPPFIMEILPDTYEHLRKIFRHYDGRIEQLNENEFFRLFLENLVSKCKEVSRVFQVAKDKMYVESSQPRRQLTKMTLIFSHMLAELRAMFPDGAYAGDTYRLTKKEAAKFWHSTFGTKWEQWKWKMNECLGYRYVWSGNS